MTSTGTRVFTDEDVRALAPSVAVDAMRQALLAAHAGRLSAPPRVSAELLNLSYVFTVGGVADGPSGFRAYRAGFPEGDQLVAVWDADGGLCGVVVGTELGVRRTAALGALAADALARPDAVSVAVIGSGRQAWAQLWALTGVRAIEAVNVYSPAPGRRAAYAQRAADELGLAAEATDTAQAAVQGADIIILATRATRPVIDADDVVPGVHVLTVGPKTVDGHETPTELAERAAVVSCDSLSQAAAYGSPFFTPRALTPLGAILAGDAVGRQKPTDLTLHCSVGLAGTEVLLAQALLAGGAPTGSDASLS